MPKLIDHDRRREEIAEATWRVILSAGISAVSIRDVAAEAGVSTGSLRHVFPSKTDLLVHAMQLVDQRARARIERHLDDPDIRSMVMAVLQELLPLDEQRRAEMQVNIALMAEAPGNPRIAEVRDETYQVLRAACLSMLMRLQAAGLASPDLDLDSASTELHGLIDGLAMHLLVNRDPAFERQALDAIESSLDRLRP